MVSQKILVIAPSWIGDLVMSQSLLRFIKDIYPSSSIDVFASKMLHPLLARMPEVDNCLESTFGHGELKLKERFRVAKKLRKNSYTHAYILTGSFKSALIPFWANISRRIGWCAEGRFFLLNDIRFGQKKLPLMVERYVALGLDKDEALPADYPWPKLAVSWQQQSEVLEKLNIKISGKLILGVFPGGEYGPAKRWPAEYFAKVAKAQLAEGWEVWIFGGDKDKNLAEEINKFCDNNCVDLTGRTDLGEAADLISLTSVVITNDTGLMHVAAALNRPTISIYGSTTPTHTPPLVKNNSVKVSLNLPCGPCFKRECPLGHNQCMVNLKPELVLKELDDIFKEALTSLN